MDVGIHIFVPFFVGFIPVSCLAMYYFFHDSWTQRYTDVFPNEYTDLQAFAVEMNYRYHRTKWLKTIAMWVAIGVATFGAWWSIYGLMLVFQ